MTTIAYRGEILATDSQVTDGNLAEGSVVKGLAHRGILAAYTGCLPIGQRFLAWVQGGMKPGLEPPMSYGDESAEGLIFPGGDRVIIRRAAGWQQIRTPFFAAGTGCELAIGAMARGATPAQAVAIAIRFDTMSGGDVQVYRRA